MGKSSILPWAFQYGQIANSHASATSCSRGAALYLDTTNTKTTVAISPLISTTEIVSDSQLIIALDFGTNFSAIAYLFTEAIRPDPEVVTTWPGLPGIFTPKTPTLLDYDRWNSSAFSWGYRVSPTSRSKIEGIKYLLDPDQALPLYIPAWDSKKVLQKLGKSPMDAASDYIGAVYQHALAIINSAYPKDFVDMQQKQFIMTCPAVWSEKAKDLTRRVRQLYD
jgi:hypothetical protein